MRISVVMEGASMVLYIFIFARDGRVFPQDEIRRREKGLAHLVSNGAKGLPHFPHG